MILPSDSSGEDVDITQPITQPEQTTTESNDVAEQMTAQNNDPVTKNKKVTEQANIALSSSNDAAVNRIRIMRAGDDVTKLYPCGYCTETSWWTKPRDHFRACHFEDANIAKTIQLADFELDDDTSDEDRDNARKERLDLGHLILNTSSFLHNARVLAAGTGQCMV